MIRTRFLATKDDAGPEESEVEFFLVMPARVEVGDLIDLVKLWPKDFFEGKEEFEWVLEKVFDVWSVKWSMDAEGIFLDVVLSDEE